LTFGERTFYSGFFDEGGRKGAAAVTATGFKKQIGWIAPFTTGADR